MEIFNKEEMVAAANQLHNILEKPVSLDCVQEFEQIAINIPWEGATANLFKDMVMKLAHTFYKAPSGMSDDMKKEFLFLAKFPENFVTNA